MPSSSSVPASLALRGDEDIEEKAKDEDDPPTSGVVARDSSSLPITDGRVVEIVNAADPELEAEGPFSSEF